MKWQEVDECAKNGNPEYLRFEATDVLKRVVTYGDLMEPLVTQSGRQAIK